MSTWNDENVIVFNTIGDVRKSSVGDVNHSAGGRRDGARVGERSD